MRHPKENGLCGRISQAAIVGVSCFVGLLSVAMWFGGLPYFAEIVSSLLNRFLLISALAGVTAVCLKPVAWPFAALCGALAGAVSGFTLAFLALSGI